MDITDCIQARRSVRKFLSKMVEWGKIGDILNAGRLAPSAGNLQNWKFVVVQDEKRRKNIAEAALQQYWMVEAPTHIVVCAEPVKSKKFYGIRGERLYSIQNCAAAIQNMLLTANNLGLGACWVSAFDEEMVKRACQIPDSVRPQAIVVIGYPAEKPAVPDKYKLMDVCYFESWENKIKDIDVAQMDYSSFMERQVKQQGKKVRKKAEKVLDKIREKTKAFG